MAQISPANQPPRFQPGRRRLQESLRRRFDRHDRQRRQRQETHARVRQQGRNSRPGQDGRVLHPRSAEKVVGAVPSKIAVPNGEVICPNRADRIEVRVSDPLPASSGPTSRRTSPPRFATYTERPARVYVLTLDPGFYLSQSITIGELRLTFAEKRVVGIRCAASACYPKEVPLCTSASSVIHAFRCQGPHGRIDRCHRR